MQGYDIFDLGGFEFNACVHNVKKGAFSSKQATKTGTTICGVIYSNGVVLGADTRSTNGETVADKNCEKIHYIAPNIYCCGAGTAAAAASPRHSSCSLAIYLVGHISGVTGR